MAKRKNKQIIAGLEGGGLIHSILKWTNSGTPERLEEIRNCIVETWSRNRHNKCNNVEPGLTKPEKWNMDQQNHN